ncbi:MAG: hypothetical protein SVW57_14270, partial [Thermodesulfobacteriota bacterium]|nr:hypothetical protein [Thermodesulfobacteriota bacterium]
EHYPVKEKETLKTTLMKDIKRELAKLKEKDPSLFDQCTKALEQLGQNIITGSIRGVFSNALWTASQHIS